MANHFNSVPVTPLQLRTLGALTIDAEPHDGSAPSVGPRALALLAVVAAAGDRGITRERILGILWPETDEEQARHTLSQTRYLLRRATRREWISGTTSLRLHADIACDVTAFLEAVEREQLERAATLYAGPFLDGFYLSGGAEFEVWVEETRTRLHFTALRVLETLARRAENAGDHRAATQWWRRLTTLDPYSAVFATALIRALYAGGDATGALGFALEYDARVRRDLETQPDPAISELIAHLRAPRAAAPLAGWQANPPDAPVAPPEAQPLAPAADAVSRRRGPFWIPVSVAATLALAVFAWSFATRASSADKPFLAVGVVQAPDTVVRGTVFRDMLATNLARIDGLQVVANSRLLELLPRGRDSIPGATADAARRVGANEIIEGELAATAGGLVLTMRRVALPSGVVRRGYTVRAADAYALTDSATAAIARDLNFDLPPDNVASVRTSSAVAYALYEEGLRALNADNAAGTLRLMEAALARDSMFAMAAYYGWLAARITQRYEVEARLYPVLRRLAARTVDRERLVIESTIATQHAPLHQMVALANEFVSRYSTDPEAHATRGRALFAAGDWAGSVAAYERSIAIDSAAGAAASLHCRVCSTFGGLVATYLWWDSAAAAERTARRMIAFRPEQPTGWAHLIEPLLRQGRRAEAEAAVARARALGPLLSHRPLLDRDLIRAGRADELEARLVGELGYAKTEEPGERPWLLTFSLRNQGRLREAQRLASERVVPGVAGSVGGQADKFSAGIVALEQGRPLESARHFLDLTATDRARHDPPALEARLLAFHYTLAGTAFAAAGDTAAVRALADSVERIGANTNYGRDARLHFFLRGLLLQQQNRHAAAVEAFRHALFSTTDGYTRTNLELARSLVALRRHEEAIAILQPALRGGIDGSNTYVTHTELRFMLAHAYEAAGQRDNAAAQYALVERAWRRADPEFGDRYREARIKATLAR